MNRLKALLVALAVALTSLMIASPASASAAPVRGCGSSGYNTVMYWNSTSAYKWQAGNYCQLSYYATNPWWLTFQSDGNFVVYDLNTMRPKYASNTFGSGNQLHFQPDGNVVIYNSSGRALWAMGQSFRAGSFDFTLGTGFLKSRRDGVTVYASKGW